MGARIEPRLRRGSALILLATMVLLAACGDSTPPGTTEPPDPEPPEPEPPDSVEPDPSVFTRYVALGNSITSGVESHGLNDSTQVHAYPVLLTEAADAPFAVILANGPGCPPPLVGPSPLTSERVGGGSATSCAGFDSSQGDGQILAFPGFRIGDAFAVPSENGVYEGLLGERTLVQAMIESEPTLVSVWLGNNDALSAALNGNLDLMTPLAEFEASVAALATAIADETDAEDAVWISTVDPQVIPAIQPGAYFWALAAHSETADVLSKPVNDGCAPWLPDGSPNPSAANLVSFFVDQDDDVPEIECDDDAPYVLNGTEQEALRTRVEKYNAAIEDAAREHGWIYIDSNALVAAALPDPDRIRKCQDLLSAATAEELETALETTCPVPGAPNFFGSLLSFDGIHPSAAGHQLIANTLAAEIEQRHESAFSR